MYASGFMTRYPEVILDNILSQISVIGIEARDLIQRAYQFAETAHRGQTRRSGEPYIQHPLNVAYILAGLHLEPAVIAAGLLHDVLEDCDVTRADLLEHFGKEVLVLVEGVTKLESVEDFVTQDRERQRDLQELESLRKLLISMVVDDIRIIFIKLADRLHNMRTLGSLELANQQRMARETLEIFAPLANRLGIWIWKAELEDLAFYHLNPTMFNDLSHLLAARQEERQERVARTIVKLKQALTEEGIERVEIKGRPKHIYSIYNKMRRKNLPFTKIYDTEGLRVMVGTESQCYQVLGAIHRLWTPVPGEFDDYIANKKPNGYQSLHTAVLGEDGYAFEIQIRTHEMHKVAEYGVAAHWLYKEQNIPVEDGMMKQIALMRQNVQELTQDAVDAQAFIELMRSDVFEDRVIVLTPKGKVMDLPQGATPLDFAYNVHTEVGHSYRGARVNGRWVPLDYQLKTGDRVEILSGRMGGPSRDWLVEDLGFIKTNRARQKIRQWFRRQSRKENVDSGRVMVDRVIRRLGLEFSVEEVAGLFAKHYQRVDDFFAAVGVGDVRSDTIAARLEEHVHPPAKEELSENVVLSPPPPPVSTIAEGISILGTGGLLTRIANCCNPLPGEDIIGYVTRGRGVTIHRWDCPNVLGLEDTDRERLIEVEWGQRREQTFPVQIIIMAYDRAGLIHDISGVLADANLNMLAVATGKRNRYNILPIYMTIEVPSFPTLTRVLSKIEQIHNVTNARRVG